MTHVYHQCLTSKQKDNDCPDPTMTQRRNSGVNSHWLSRSAVNLHYTGINWNKPMESVKARSTTFREIYLILLHVNE